MGQVRVGLLGYGVIGRRVADAVRAQPDMEVVGVAGRPTSFSLRPLSGMDTRSLSQRPPDPTTPLAAGVKSRVGWRICSIVARSCSTARPAACRSP